MTTASFVDKLVGTYHFLTDRVPDGTSLVNPKPSTVNPWCSDGQALVAREIAGSDLRASVNRVIILLGGLGQAIGHGDKVLVKPIDECILVVVV